MGVKVEFNAELALRRHGKKGRGPEECLPRRLDVDAEYNFLKKGQRNYWFGGDIPLYITSGREKVSSPIASIRIIEATHCRKGEEIWTRGVYRIVEVYAPGDKEIRFKGLRKNDNET